MTRIAQNNIRTDYAFLLCSSLLTLMLTGVAGCAFAGDPILPPQLQSRLESSDSTADDHLAAARLYRQHAQQLEADATRYTREAENITPLEDTKGFRRSALKTAAQELERQAQQMAQLSTEYQRKAETMTASGIRQ